jgi:hypothetical protein
MQAIKQGKAVQVKADQMQFSHPPKEVWEDVTEFTVNLMLNKEWRIKPTAPVVTEIWADINPNNDFLVSSIMTSILGVELRDWRTVKTTNCTKRYKITAEEWPEE